MTIRLRIKWLTFGLVCLVLFLSCAARSNQWGIPEYQYTYRTPERIDDGWEVSSLHEEGLDSVRIDALISGVLKRDFKNIHSILLVKNGKLVLEEYFYGYDRDMIHQLHSVSKSITSILVGIAIDQGKIKGVEDSVYDFFADHADSKWVNQRYDISLAHALMMSAGIDWDERSRPLTDRRNDIVAMIYGDDWLNYVLNKNQVEPPGRSFNYSGGITVLLGGMVKNSSGMYADEFAEKYLFGPLGITQYRWQRSSSGTINTQGGLSLRPRDMAKIGLLLLDGGRWKDKQIVSEHWVNESLKGRLPAWFGLKYGYQWWSGKAPVNHQEIESFFAWGRGGQYIFVIPDCDLVAVITSRPYDNHIGAILPLGLMPNFIVKAALPGGSVRKTVQLDSKAVGSYPGLYQSNDLGIKLSVTAESGKLFVKIGNDEKVEITPLSETEFHGTMQDLGDFTIGFDEIGTHLKTALQLNYGFLHEPFVRVQ